MKHLDFFRQFWRLLTLFLIFCCLLGAQRAHGDASFEKKGIPKIIFENSLYQYHKENYFLAALQFSSLIEKYPRFQGITSSINYYISSLSYLNDEDLLSEALQKYKAKIDPDTFFVLVKNYQRSERDKEAITILNNLSQMNLSSEKKDRISYYKALSLLKMDAPKKEILKTIDSISKGSLYFVKGVLFKSELLYRNRDRKKAISTLKSISKMHLSSSRYGEDGIQDKISLLLGQMYFDGLEFEKAKDSFNAVKKGPFYSDALIGSHWASFKNSDYIEAAEKLLLHRKTFPDRFSQDDLLVNLAFLYFYAGEFEVSGKYFSELSVFLKKKKELAESLINDESVMKKFLYLFLREEVEISFFEYQDIPDRERELFRIFKVNPELLNFLELYRFGDMLSKEQIRSATLINKYKSYFKKRAMFLKLFIDSYKTLRPDFLSLKKTLMEIELPVEDLPAVNREFIIERLNDALKKYEKEKERPPSKLEQQLVKILIFEEYVSFKSMDKHMEIFKMALKMMSMLENLYGKSGNIWVEEVNLAIDDFNKTRETALKFDPYSDLHKDVEHLRYITFQFLSGYIKKEAYRVLKKIERVTQEVEEARKTSLSLFNLKAEKSVPKK